jgi:cardiolipin synthase A/B
MLTVLAIIASVFATVVLTLVALNFTAGDNHLKYELIPAYGVKDAQFLNVMSQLLGPPIVNGNSVIGLQNGDEIFPALLLAIRSATKTICFETYIYWSGSIGTEFSDALCERAQAGVKIHMLLDWFGSDKIDPKLIDRMKSAGVEVERFRPPRWYNLSRMNSRTHRKLLIVDGRVGFTGGVGIADVWLGDAESPEHWRDSHFQLEGPAVAQLQAAFMDNWLKARAMVHHSEEYFPPLSKCGDSLAQVFKSSAMDGSESVRLMYLLSIAAAEKSILLANAYFVPDDLAIRTLIAAKQRGVGIQIIVPGNRTDMPMARRASRACWGPLLEAGIEIYEYQPTMYHCKVMIVDGLWTSVGSTNFDNRSFRLNDEANLNISDKHFADEETRKFEADKRKAKRITLSEWRNRPFNEKLREWLSALLRSQL